MANTILPTISAANITESDIDQILAGNYLYEQNHKRWKFLLDSFMGGNQYKRGNYLTRYQLETEKEYELRVDATPLDNQCASVISVYNSFLFREEPSRDYGSIANLPELADFIKDVDFEGRSIDQFMKEVSTWTNVFGSSWVIVSKPNIGAVTKADELAVNLRPYLSIITPLTVLDWKWDRDVTGRYNLTYLKYIEEVNGDVLTIKAWTNDAINTYVIDSNNKKMVNTDIELNQPGEIPAVIAYSNRSMVRGLGISTINDIADMQRSIYNSLSESGESIRLDSHPSLVKTPDTTAGVGAGAIIHMPDNLDPALKPYILDFAGASIDNIYKTIDWAVGSIDKMAALGAVRSTQSSAMSGVALDTEFQLLNAKLSSLASNLELAEEQIWRLWCKYQSQSYDMTIEYPSSFSLRDTKDEITQIKIASECGSTDPRIKAAIDAELLDWFDLDQDELAAIEDKALLNPESVDEPGEIPSGTPPAYLDNIDQNSLA